MPEVTVSMPAYNAGKYITQAIASVLHQEGVNFELVVVDDGSTDNTSEIVRSFNDDRITLIRNKMCCGISYCHNLIIRKSRSPFIIHVDSDDTLLNRFALKKSIELLKSNPKIGQTHCYYLVINENGKITIDQFFRQCEIIKRHIRSDMNYRRELLINGTVINHLRAYRKDVFSVVGMFNENLRYGEDWEMALRIIDKYEIRLIPEFLYAARIHKANTFKENRCHSLAFSLRKLTIYKNLLKEGRVHYFNEFNVYRFFVLGIVFGLIDIAGSYMGGSLKYKIKILFKKCNISKIAPWLNDYPGLRLNNTK